MNTPSVKVDTFLYGDVTVDYGLSEITGTYLESEPRSVVRIGRLGDRTHERTPIGTRTESNLRATIDDRSIVLRPGTARFFKRSYRVRIEVDGRILVLSAKNLEDSTLLDGESDRGDNSFGDFTRDFGGGVDIVWSAPFPFTKKIVEPPIPSRVDALIGVVVAAAFGTGGLSASTIVMSVVGSIFPS